MSETNRLTGLRPMTTEKAPTQCDPYVADLLELLHQELIKQYGPDFSYNIFGKGRMIAFNDPKVGRTLPNPRNTIVKGQPIVINEP